MCILEKKVLRDRARGLLSGLSHANCRRWSTKIAEQVSGLPQFRQSGKIACYMPIGNEVGTTQIIETIWSLGSTCYLPVIADEESGYGMVFASFTAYDQLVARRYGLLEPCVVNRENRIEVTQLDCVIVPMLGFNAENFRLGRGGGYYDRIFQFKQQNRCVRPYLIGIGYRMQKMNFVADLWDVPMEIIITN